MSGLIYPLNNKEYTAEDVEIFNCTRTSGVYSVLDFDYTLSGYSMTIGKGLAWIKNSDFSGKAIAFKEPEELTFEEPHERLERYDVVAIRFDADTQDAQLVIIKGEPSESPRLPPRSTFAWEYELFLYSILRKPSDYNISSDNITDLREDEAYCGIMRDSVTSGVAPLQEVIVENANLKQGEFIDFDANKYTHLVATVNITGFSCDVVLSKVRDTFGIGKVGFTGMTSMYPPGESTHNTIFVGAQIEGKTTENIGHHIRQISFSYKPEFVGEDFSGAVSISKIVGVCERPEGYVKVDSLYNAESNNAQSGTAVAKAIGDAVKVASDNAKDLITESVDPHFIGDSERAQSGVAVSEALESKQDRLFAGWNIKTINHETLLGSGDVTIDFSEDIDKTNDKLKRLAESIDLNTLDGWVCRANVSTDGKWQDVNAVVLSTYVSVVPTTPGERLVISKNAANKNAYFACLTGFKEPVEGESLMFSSDPVLGKVVKPGENEEYTIPSDTKFIVVSVDGDFVNATPSKFILGGYDYLLSGRANVKSIADNSANNAKNLQNQIDEKFNVIYEQTSRNALDKTKLEKGWLVEDGTVEVYSSFVTSDYIPITENLAYALRYWKEDTAEVKASRPRKVCLYNEDKVLVPGSYANSTSLPHEGVFTGGSYVRVSFDGTLADTIMILLGDTSTDGITGYIPYGVTNIYGLSEKVDISDKVVGKQDVLVSGENIKTINNESIVGSGNVNISSFELYEEKRTRNMIDASAVVNGRLTEGGLIEGYANYVTSDFISITNGIAFKLVWWNEAKTGDDKTNAMTIYRACFYDENKEYISYATDIRSSTTNFDVEGAAFIRITLDSVSMNKAMLLLDDTNTFWIKGYLPYIERTYKIPSDVVIRPKKKVVAAGDSITFGAETNRLVSYMSFACKKLGFELENNSISGSTLGLESDGTNPQNALIERYTDMSDDADLVYIASGTNDWFYQYDLGVMSDRVKTTFYGALHLLCQGLKQKYPTVPIVFATPIKRWVTARESNLNLNGQELNLWRNAIKEVCEYHGIPVVDMYAESYLNAWEESERNKYMPDGTHPNEKGHAKMQITCEAVLNKYLGDYYV